jgi:hypothetical protein
LNPVQTGRLGWGVIEERDVDRNLCCALTACVEFVATPHPSLPLKGEVKKVEAILL